MEGTVVYTVDLTTEPVVSASLDEVAGLWLDTLSYVWGVLGPVVSHDPTTNLISARFQVRARNSAEAVARASMHASAAWRQVALVVSGVSQTLPLRRSCAWPETEDELLELGVPS